MNWGNDMNQDRENNKLVPLWVEEMLGYGVPETDVMNTLQATLEDYLGLMCDFHQLPGQCEEL